MKTARPVRVRGRSAALKRSLDDQTTLRLWVQAVVVIWGNFPAGLVDDDGIVYIRGDRLADWLESHPAKLSARNQRLVELALEAETVAPVATAIAS